MSGMNMLMRSMGINPEEIIQSVTVLVSMGADLKAQLDRIENKLDAVLQQNSDEVVSSDVTRSEDNG